MKNRSKFPYGIPPFQTSESWAKKSVRHFLVKGKEEKEIIGIKIETDKESFIIPVMDSRRDFDKERLRNFTKSQNIGKGSQYFAASYSCIGYSYNKSMKRFE